GDAAAVAAAKRFLHEEQLPDGSWAATPRQGTGCWVTALACLTLLADVTSEPNVTAGLSWLCDDWPRDSTPWRRLLDRFSTQQKVSPLNRALRGWGWTPL